MPVSAGRTRSGLHPRSMLNLRTTLSGGVAVGHTRLGTIPKLRKWQDVVSAYAANQGSEAEVVARVADLTLAAAEQALERAANDRGLQACFFALTQLVLAARQPDWLDSLAAAGMDPGRGASVFDVTAALQGFVDDSLQAEGTYSDVSEIAQRAMGQAVLEMAEPNARTLFGSAEADVQDAVKGLSTKVGFARLGQHFFGHFLARFLNSYVSRISADAAGRERPASVGEISHFNAALTYHCVQSARIVRDFCGEWYSKTEFTKKIDRGNSANFVGVAVRKLAAELHRQRSDG